MELVTAMNRVIIDSTTMDKYATAWFGLYDHTTCALTSINAGHNPPYIFRPGQALPIELNAGGLFLGMMDMPYETEAQSMHHGDALVFFTDGVTEAWNEQEEDYEERRLIAIVDKHRDGSASQILDAIEADVNRHVNGATQSDDFTCGIIKFI